MLISRRCCVGHVTGRPVGGMSVMILLSMVALLLSCVVDKASAGCNGMCEACAHRYGCMTPAWGKCCTQFYQHNGRKRNAATSGLALEDTGVMSDRQLSSSAATRPLKTSESNAMASWAKGIIPKKAVINEVAWHACTPIDSVMI